MSVIKKDILVEKLEMHHMSSTWEKHQYNDLSAFQRTIYQVFASCCADGKVAMFLRVTRNKQGGSKYWHF